MDNFNAYADNYIKLKYLLSVVKSAIVNIKAPQAGIEPATNWLTANCSTAELLWNASIFALHVFIKVKYLLILPLAINRITIIISFR